MKYAFLVGIDEYKKKEWRLNGCKRDAFDMYSLLTNEFAFDKDNVRVLVDERATKQAILHRLNWLVSVLQSGDVGVFYYSGHGTRVRDRNGDELSDGLDECLVSYDFSWDDPLTDDEIAEVLSKLHQDSKMYIIFDCCHSGTATRELENPLLAASFFGDLSSDAVVRYIPPPLDISLRSFARDFSLKKYWYYLKSYLFGEDKTVDSLDVTLNHCFMSASRDDQVSLEVKIDGYVRGVFTYYFTKYFRDSNNRNKPLAIAHREIVSAIKAAGFNQDPQLESEESFKSGIIFS